MKYTITFDEKAKGWPSFHSFIPDWMSRMNNRFFSVKDGQLYLHNNEDSSTRNNFYGVQYSTTVTYIINDATSAIKVLKTINTESNKALHAEIKSYINDETTSITRSTVETSEFMNKEGKWHAYVRRNELLGDFTAKNFYGVGRADSVLGSVISFTGDIATSLISIGDTLLDENQVDIGVIQSYTSNSVTVDTTPVIVPNLFLLGTKEGRIEGSDIRGYNFEITLTDDSSSRLEIFASSSELFKSEPS